MAQAGSKQSGSKAIEDLSKDVGPSARFVVEHLIIAGFALLVFLGDKAFAFLNRRSFQSWALFFFLAVTEFSSFLLFMFETVFHLGKYLVNRSGTHARKLSKYVPIAALAVAAGCTAFYFFKRLPELRYESALLEGTALSNRLVMMGSSNVRSRLIESKALDANDSNVLWVDLGSGAAQRNIFQAFDYGDRTEDGNKRFGLIALSSDGTCELEKLYNNPAGDPKCVAWSASKASSWCAPKKTVKSANPKQKDECPHPTSDGPRQKTNFWLEIKLLKVPMALLYRGKGPEVASPAQLPSLYRPNGHEWPQSYGFVRFTRFRDYYQDKRLAANFDAPEADSGTRILFERKAGPIEWPRNGLHYTTYLSDFADWPSFGELVSAAPLWSAKESQPATCRNLKPFSKAIVCADDDCRELVWAQLSVVMKVKGELPENRSFEITNKAECDFANKLAPNSIHKGEDGKCEGHASSVTNHIATIAITGDEYSMPGYLDLNCKDP